MAFFTELEQKFSWFLWKQKRPQKAKAVLRKKNGAGGINLPDSNVRNFLTTKPQSSREYGTGTKAGYRPMEQDRKPRNNPCIYGYLIFDKEGKNIQWGKGSLFNKWCYENWAATCERMKLQHFLTPYTNINSRWINT